MFTMHLLQIIIICSNVVLRYRVCCMESRYRIHYCIAITIEHFVTRVAIAE